MTYQSNVPLGTDRLSSSAADLRNNFGALATAIAVNHVALNDAGQGKHAFLQMPEQLTAPTTSADEGGLYTKDVSGATELFYRRESNGDEYQLTGDFTAAADGEVTLPGGLILKWGVETSPSSDQTVTYPSAYTSATYNVQLTYGSGTSSLSTLRATSLTASSFVINSSGLLTVYWLAIGV